MRRVPASENLEAGDCARRDVHLRLIEWDEAARREPALDLGAERGTAHRLFAKVGSKTARSCSGRCSLAALSASAALVISSVGAAPVAGERRDTDGKLDGNLLPEDLERAHAADEAASAVRRLLFGHVFKQQGELVVADTRREVAGRRLAQAPRECAQERIAEIRAADGVHFREAVDVEE